MDRTDLKQHLVRASLELAADQLWEDVSLRQIADVADVGLDVCRDAGITRPRLIGLLEAYLDTGMLEAAKEIDLSDMPRDRLFEVLMARVDALEADRQAWTSILLGEGRSTGARLRRAPFRLRTAQWVLEAAAINQTDGLLAAKCAGLARLWWRQPANHPFD